MAFTFTPRISILLPVATAAGLLLAGCASRHYFQPDARVGAGSTAPLPATADSVWGTAGRHYNQHWLLHKAVWGWHYRAVWATPVQAPVLRLSQAVPGGLRAGKPGGGYQSISMTLEGRDGREYSLRALDKEPKKTLPKILRPSFVLNVVRDATSAALPYGALTLPPLAQAAGVPHGRPRMVYVRPDEQGLGSMSAQFQGKLALLEEKYEALASRTPDLARATVFLDSDKMLEQVYAKSAATIDEAAFLRARLLDVWVGDWDRHEGQWTWAALPGPAGHVRYQAIPKDRDQVYFRFDDGLVPWLASRPFIAPKFQTFRAHYGNVAGLVNQAHFIDERGLASLSRPDFLRMAQDLQRRLPDTLIQRAVRQLPPPIYAKEGPGLVAALTARRDALPQAAEAFYRALARKPVVGGTAGAERFVVTRYPDSASVRVYSRTQGRPAPADSLQFHRTYFAADTRAIALEGLGGNDVFEIRSETASKLMPVDLYGGSGQDELRLQGSARHLRLYDNDAPANAAGSVRPQPPPKKHRAYDRLADD